jgi:hypothetical protein
MKQDAVWGEAKIAVINHGVYVSSDVLLPAQGHAHRAVGTHASSSRASMRGLDRGIHSAVARPPQGEGRTHDKNDEGLWECG